MSDYLYRVVVREYPEGALSPVADDLFEFTPGWAPAGWEPRGQYEEILGTTDFVWPTTRKEYRSRSTAAKRAKLLEYFGATVEIQRSSKIEWPS